VAVRNVRRDVIKDLKDFEKEKLISEDELTDAEEELKELTAEMIDSIDVIGDRKEKEILEV
jgi:ribosome recycling factor